MKLIIPCLAGVGLLLLTGCEGHRHHGRGDRGGAYRVYPEHPGYGHGEYRGYPNYPDYRRDQDAWERWKRTH